MTLKVLQHILNMPKKLDPEVKAFKAAQKAYEKTPEFKAKIKAVKSQISATYVANEMLKNNGNQK